MSTYALLREAAYEGKLSVSDVEIGGALDSNLCRCTGYAPIFRAVKTFVGDYLAPKRESPSSLWKYCNQRSQIFPLTLAENGAGPSHQDHIVPLNFEASGLERERAEEAKSGCCKGVNPAAEKAAEVSADGELLS